MSDCSVSKSINYNEFGELEEVVIVEDNSVFASSSNIPSKPTSVYDSYPFGPDKIILT